MRNGGIRPLIVVLVLILGVSTAGCTWLRTRAAAEQLTIIKSGNLYRMDGKKAFYQMWGGILEFEVTNQSGDNLTLWIQDVKCHAGSTPPSDCPFQTTEGSCSTSPIAVPAGPEPVYLVLEENPTADCMKDEDIDPGLHAWDFAFYVQPPAGPPQTADPELQIDRDSPLDPWMWIVALFSVALVGYWWWRRRRRG